MENQYVAYRRFQDAHEAKALQQVLIDNGMECLFVDASPPMGGTMAGEMNKQYEIQLKPGQFEAADKLLETHAEKMMGDLPDDYYLLSFTDEELYEVVLKHDEWSEFDYVLARKLLTERGKPIDEALIKSLRKQRMDDLAKPEGNQHAWIIVGYVLAVLGGFFGFITGYVLWTSKKTLPNGQVVPTYSEGDRAHGKIILILGIIMIPIYITYYTLFR